MFDFENIDLEPKVYTMEQVAKMVGFGRNTLFDVLKELGVLKEDNTPNDEYVEKGLIKHVNPIKNGREYAPTTRVTPEGVKYIRELISLNFNLFEEWEYQKRRKAKEAAPYSGQTTGCIDHDIINLLRQCEGLP